MHSAYGGQGAQEMFSRPQALITSQMLPDLCGLFLKCALINNVMHEVKIFNPFMLAQHEFATFKLRVITPLPLHRTSFVIKTRFRRVCLRDH